MAIIKCKMCGGDMELSADKTFGTCEYCGCVMTLPRLSDEQRTAAFNRGNHFRRTGEFDKALAVYERIVQEDDTDAEAHWCCALCRFGIEYVEDPATYEWIPTCHRASFDSILEDVDYLAAVEHSEGITKRQYQKDAAKIAEVQRGILATSQNEEPFDVFICYKESDEQGNRTVDSTLAQDIYYQLTEQGLRVFFSRITLEDKVGSEYEPYIFAALHSAKVMVVVGTKPEHFNAVWVKNEWSRYLMLVKKDRHKLILPCYRDMNPYDLPEQLSVLQSYDMSKIGFVQDLVRGIKKVTEDTTKKAITAKEAVTPNGTGINATALLKRAFLSLEDGDWDKADDFCEQVLNQDPECAEAYLGKLMAELQVKTRKQLADCAEPFDNRDNYSKVIRFGDDKIEAEMRGYIKHINDRNENTRLTGIYNNAVNAMNAAKSEDAYKSAADTFKSIIGFKDADTLTEKCLEKAEVCRKDEIYSSAKEKMTGDKVVSYEEAIKVFQTISGWKDANEQVYACQKKIEEIKAKEEADRLEAERKAEERRIAAEKAAKKRKKIIAIGTPIVCACIAFAILLKMVIIPKSNYNSAIELMNDGNIIEAYESLIALNGYKDSTEKASEIYSEYEVEKLKVAEVGDVVVFGSYEQDNNTSNGKENIEWLVLAKEDNKLLVISDKALDCQQYNTSYTDVTWETCSLRKWMNDTFLNNAFSVEEQAQIQSATVSADNKPNYSTNPGNATTDKVFLLSITEAEKYFSSDSARRCKPTDYAVANGAYVNSNNGGCWWWLRSPGFDQVLAALVHGDGSVYYGGSSVNYADNCVRPAMWISIGD